MGSDSLRTVLIDADVLVYQAGYYAETAVDWDNDGRMEVYADKDMALSRLRSDIAEIVGNTGADLSLLCLSDPDNNFRKRVDPTYKANRGQSVRKPILYGFLREVLQEDMASVWYPWLEGDDVMGILQTLGEDTTVIASIDKDMKTIPGELYNPKSKETIHVTEEEADWYHMYQTLMGDAVDEYKGCPGIGPVKAKKALDCDRPHWEVVVELFENAGLEEGDALVQARLARILRDEDYDRINGEVKLWSPK